MNQYQTILGVGATLMDLLAHVPDSFLSAAGRPKGGMTLVDPPAQRALLAELAEAPGEAPGGSACNTLSGLARLGSRARFFGKRGPDPLGDRLAGRLSGTGLGLDLATGSADTGCVLSAVTPDAQRTMFTSLGASAELSTADVDALDLSGVGLLYLEGYLLFNLPVFDRLVERAGKAGIPLALDCGSYDVVGMFRDRLMALLGGGAVRILLANEDEARAFTEAEPEPSLEWLANHAEIAVVKIGARGALVAQGPRRAVVPAVPVSAVVDTTGAGDLWAAGFLAGLDRGWDLSRAGHLAARTASEVVQVLGAEIPAEGWARLAAEVREA